MLDSLGFPNFAKTTGSRGIHIYVPIHRGPVQKQVWAFAKSLYPRERACFELNAFEDGKLVMKMPVVVGKEFKPTPLFSDRMTYIVLNPNWNVPASIAKEEVLPRVQTDPEYLTRNDLEVLPPEGNEVVDASSIEWTSLDPETLEYRFRQKPGDGNSLGRIKSMFPNQFDVYLHDTPAEQLFKRTRRDLSHGCVRVSRPLDLAAWLLEDSPEWTRDKLADKISDNIEQTEEELTEETIKLPSPLRVYILYWTAWVQDDKTVSFRDDVYDEDKRLLRSLPPQVARSGEARRVCEQQGRFGRLQDWQIRALCARGRERVGCPLGASAEGPVSVGASGAEVTGGRGRG